MKNCFCSLCQDSREVIVEVVLSATGLFSDSVRRVMVPCPGCSLPIDYVVVESKPVAAE